MTAMTPFHTYKKAHDEMEADEKIQRLRVYIEKQVEVLAELEAPYHDRMSAAAKAIEELVMAEGKTVQLCGVRGTYKKGRKGEPSVVVSMVED